MLQNNTILRTHPYLFLFTKARVMIFPALKNILCHFLHLMGLIYNGLINDFTKRQLVVLFLALQIN